MAVGGVYRPGTLLANSDGLIAMTGIPDAPSDGTLYGRENGAWVPALPLAGGALSAPGNLTVGGTLAVTGSTSFTLAPTAPTAAPGDSSTTLATTAFVATSFAPIANPTFTGLVTPGANGIKGVAAASNAPAGSVGEYISATATAQNAAASGNFFPIASVSLTAGDWDVWGSVIGGAAGNGITQVGAAVSTAAGSGGLTGGDWNFGDGFGYIYCPSGSSGFPVQSGVSRVSLAATTTVYVNGYCTYTTGTPTFSGKIQARRVR